MGFPDRVARIKDSLDTPPFDDGSGAPNKAIRVAYQGDVILATSEDPGFDEFVKKTNKMAFVKLKVKTVHVHSVVIKPEPPSAN